ncbi:alpha/beta fold hydrolase [Sabulicella glaciei]|uniref:Alpha/beta fold hydrolase n=1 Tax=Sabulicella glaciei TaxID=2984948 RepID=A0ABT3NZP2_9PROT|nr:alpha/beta fold hydrolase [Roseococcus sp. MDT2-1-1]MCW8087634.1 alpha/beta fold hydrolase [Roseococcus sp. MDT2-1-1]
MAIPLLLLPGLLCDARLWRDCLGAVEGVAAPVVADLTLDETMAGMAQRALALMEGADRFAVAGLSMGGYVALEVMRQAGPRVAALALLDTSARPDSEEARRKRLDLIALSQRGQFRGVTPRLLPQLLHRSRLDTPLAEEVKEMAARVGAEAFLRQQRAIMGRADSRPLLPSIAVSALVGVGEADVLTPPELAEEMAAAIPNAVLRRFAGCGHLPTMEDPEAAGAALREWLGRA